MNILMYKEKKVHKFEMVYSMIEINPYFLLVSMENCLHKRRPPIHCISRIDRRAQRQQQLGRISAPGGGRRCQRSGPSGRRVGLVDLDGLSGQEVTRKVEVASANGGIEGNGRRSLISVLFY